MSKGLTPSCHHPSLDGSVACHGRLRWLAESRPTGLPLLRAGRLPTPAVPVHKEAYSSMEFRWNSTPRVPGVDMVSYGVQD
jgi:hypothetical protein